MNLRKVFETEISVNVSNTNSPKFNPRIIKMLNDTTIFTHVQVHIIHPPNGLNQNLSLMKLPHFSNIMPSRRQSSNQFVKEAQTKEINNIDNILLIGCKMWIMATLKMFLLHCA